MKNLRRFLPAVLITMTAGDSPAAAETGWTATSLPGPPSAMLPDPVRAGVLYAATQDGNCGGGAVFRSLTAGAEWELAAVVPEGFQVSSFAVDRGSSAVYAALFQCRTASESRIYRSRDAGTTWELVQTLGNIVLRDLTSDPQTPGTLYEAGYSAGIPAVCEQYPWIPRFFCPFHFAAELLRSSNSGVSWRNMFAGAPDNPTSFDQIAVDPTDPNRLFARAPDAVWASTDRGIHWNEAARPGCGVHSIALTRASTLRILVGLGSSVSSDFCSLALASSPVERPQFESQPASVLPFGNAGVDVESLAVSPADLSTVYVAYRAAPLSVEGEPRPLLAVSHDGGATWSRISWDDGTVRDLAVDASGAFVYAVTALDVFRTPAPRERHNPRPVRFR